MCEEECEGVELQTVSGGVMVGKGVESVKEEAEVWPAEAWPAEVRLQLRMKLSQLPRYTYTRSQNRWLKYIR